MQDGASAPGSHPPGALGFSFLTACWQGLRPRLLFLIFQLLSCQGAWVPSVETVTVCSQCTGNLVMLPTVNMAASGMRQHVQNHG